MKPSLRVCVACPLHKVGVFQVSRGYLECSLCHRVRMYSKRVISVFRADKGDFDKPYSNFTIPKNCPMIQEHEYVSNNRK